MTGSTEREIIERETERLTAEGLEVFIAPGQKLTPPFTQGYMPDIIAIGNGRKIALEVASRNDARSNDLSKVAALFDGHPEWEFQVIWPEPAGRAPSLPVQAKEQIQSTILEIKKIRGDQHLRPSFLLAWAAFEAAARAIAEREFVRAQSPGRVVRILGREGYLSPAEADVMRGLAEKRNRLIHGALDAQLEANDVDQLVGILESVTAEIAA